MELDFLGLVLRIPLNVKCQRTEKIELFSKGTYDSQNLRYEALATADYEYVKISRIAVTDINLWMKDLDLHTGSLLKLIQIYSSESTRFMQNIFSF